MDVIQRYQHQNEKINSSLLQAKKKTNLWTAIRLVAFLGFVAGFVFIVQLNVWIGIAALYLFIITFIKIVKYHNQLVDEQALLTRRIDNNNKEIRYKQDHNTDLDDGTRYKNPLHPYSSDLDLFGDQSMFQLMVRCNTKIGRDRLAKRLLNKLSKEEINENQRAISALVKKEGWSQQFYAYTVKKDDQFNPDHVQKWLDLDDAWMNSRLLHILSFVLPVIGLMLIYFLANRFGLMVALLALLPHLFLLRHYYKRIEEAQKRVEETLKYVTKYAPLIQHIERSNFENKKLQKIQSSFEHNGTSTSQQLIKLDGYFDQLELKYNVFGMIFNLIFLWDFHFVRLLYKWKTKNGKQIYMWLDALAEMEFLNSLSILAHNHPNWTFPEITDKNEISANSIVHPLIHPNRAVDNTIDLCTHGHIKLITGSNMGGKSTFLRTIGLNLILAFTGSKVSAKKMETEILDVVTSMRTNDALKDNTSGFYAELKRLKLILDEVKRNEDNYFLIDEVLKGTNTKDRHEGSKALIRQLIEHNGAGLISTHDLELAEMEKQLNGQLENKCFEVEVNDDELVFDYKIRDGVSKSFNATQLMRNMGIDL